MNMLKTFSNTSASKIEAIEPEGLHATITIVWKHLEKPTVKYVISSFFAQTLHNPKSDGKMIKNKNLKIPEK